MEHPFVRPRWRWTKADKAVNVSQFKAILGAFISALEDYSTDQRGDVGSWIRLAGINALAQGISVASRQPAPQEYINPDDLDLAIGGILKLGMEKLEPVRAASWRAWRAIRDVEAQTRWRWNLADIWDFEVKDDR